MGAFNQKAINTFGLNNINMSIDSPSISFDERFSKLTTYLDMQVIFKNVLPRLPKQFRENPCILDVGAGKGRMTRKFVEIAKRVVAIEPFEPFYQVLSVSCSAKNLETYQCALLEYKKIAKYLFDIIYISGVSPYLDDDEFVEFMSEVNTLLQPWGIVCVRERGTFRKLSIRSSSEILRTPYEISLVAEKTGFSLIQLNRAYPIIFPWIYYQRYPNRFSRTLYNMATLECFFSLWSILPKINLNYSSGVFWVYLLSKM